MPYAITHKRLGGYLAMVNLNPSSSGESVPWLRKTLRPDAIHATPDDAEAVRTAIGEAFYSCYEVTEIAP